MHAIKLGVNLNLFYFRFNSIQFILIRNLDEIFWNGKEPFMKWEDDFVDESNTQNLS